MKKYLFGGIFVALLLGIGVLYILFTPAKQLSESEKNAALKNLLGRNPMLEEKKISTTWLTHKTPVIIFSYPDSAQIREVQNNQQMENKNIVDSFSFDVKTPHLFVTVQVRQNNSAANLDELSDIALRKSQSWTYKQSDVWIGSLAGLAFSKNDEKSEKTAFFLQNGKEYTFAVTGYSATDVSDFLDKLIRTVSL